MKKMKKKKEANIDLFKKIFTELNKKHIKAALKEYGAEIFGSGTLFGRGISGFDQTKYKEMVKYSEVNNPLRNNYEQEMREHAPSIDLIHEMVIISYPSDASSVEDVQTILSESRDALLKSSKDYFIDKPQQQMFDPESDDKIRDIVVTAKNNDKTKLTANLADLIKTNDNAKKIGTVAHMEAIAELHRYAHDIPLEDALSVVAHAASITTTTTTTTTTPTIKDVPKNPYEDFPKEPYVIADKAPKSYGGGVKTNYGKDLVGKASIWPTSIGELNKWIENMIAIIHFGSESKSSLKVIDGNINILDPIKSQVVVYQTIGDGSCLIHALLTVTCSSYRNLSDGDKQTIGNRFRTELFGLMPYDESTNGDKFFNRVLGENGDGKDKNGKYIYLGAEELDVFCDFFKVNMFTFTSFNYGFTLNSKALGHPKYSHYFMYYNGNHYSAMSLLNRTDFIVEYGDYDENIYKNKKYDQVIGLLKSEGDFPPSVQAWKFIINGWLVTSEAKAEEEKGGEKKGGKILKTRNARPYKNKKTKRNR